jgi:acetyl-CoA synthetase
VWRDFRSLIRSTPALRDRFEAQSLLYHRAYEGRAREAGPGPAWLPEEGDLGRTNLGAFMKDLKLARYEDLHRWSVEHRDAFWEAAIRRLGVRFRTNPDRIRDPGSPVTRPEWLPGAVFNIAESCFSAEPGKLAILTASEADATVRRITYGDLHRLASRVANGFEALGVRRGERVALDLPMTAESVAIYLGAILAGRSVVGIADASAAMDIEKRLRIGGARAVFTVDAYVRDGKEHRIYEKVVEAHAPQTIVLPSADKDRVKLERSEDIAWSDFLGDGEAFDAVPGHPGDVTNVLFSSGTTKDPKAIVWTQTTPIKAAADAFLHHDVQPDDVLAWPTSYGWMMGPWLTYASLVNGAAMALYVGATQRRAYGEFVAEAGVTMLGVVPKLVRGWKSDRTMEGVDWSHIRRFSSTGETSSPEEMLYLMALAGYKPVIEYCGGTEVGGAYITGTMVQPCAPSCFTTPALGLDFVILDDGRPASRGEVYLVPPSIGLANDLLNYDSLREYYAGAPPGPDGEILRRHGDQVERLGGGYFRHHGRIDDMVNIYGVKSSAEEIRSVLAHELVSDAKPVAVDVGDTGRHSLVIYAVPRDPSQVGNAALAARLRADFQRDIKERLNPLLAHVHDVVLVTELPQAGAGKTKTMKALRQDYESRRAVERKGTE